MAASEEWFCRHFHIPLQSGDNEILKRMNRNYTSEEYARLVESIHSQVPLAAIGADLMAGFPGEEGKAHRNTYDLLKDLTDVFSPMVYHGRMGRDAVWVKDNMEWFCKRMDIKPGTFPKVWPIVQAYDDPRPISPEELGEVLGYGSACGAAGRPASRARRAP